MLQEYYDSLCFIDNCKSKDILTGILGYNFIIKYEILLFIVVVLRFCLYSMDTYY